ncbi:MAG: hypothetical protein RBU30_12035 [Polyangia bacterium]|jgi:hypothetical protein|nr:hypothetical protein [Polyangia bacterium]
MKALAIIALVLGLSAVGVAGYHLLETWPNVKSAEQRMERSRQHERYVSHGPSIEDRLWMSYRQAAFNQVYTMWGLGGLGLILGVIGAIKARKTFRVLALVATASSVAALIVSLTTIMASRLG